MAEPGSRHPVVCPAAFAHRYDMGMFLASASEWIQIGVHSEGFGFIGGVPVVTVSGRVDGVAPWLRDELEGVHGDRDFCQVNGWYDDGVCDDACESPDPDCDSPSDAGTDAEAPRPPGTDGYATRGTNGWVPAA